MRRATGLLLAMFVLPALLQAQAIAYDYSSLYELSMPGIVQVTTDNGKGSGFLVSSYGHIATNFHVIRNSRYLAVQFPDGRKVRAAVVAVNPHYDLAVLKVNSDIVVNLRPLPVLPENKDASIKVGIPVVALGSPLNQKFLMTQGILSKVDETTMLGDFLLQPGNSGGPLLNCDGQVIGINTFGEASIGGAIRINALRAYLDATELLADSIETQPPADLLRSISSERYPVEILNYKVQNEPLDWSVYKIKAGDFVMTVLTPVLIGKIQVMQERMRQLNRQERRSKHISDPSFHGLDPYYDWHRSTETSLDCAITFDIRPESGLTRRSHASKVLSPFLMFGKTGKLEMEFKGEFLEFRIYRDGELIEPIMPGRSVIEGSSDRKSRFVDQAYAGSYVYSPEDFLVGKEFRMQIIDARKPDEVHKEVIFDEDSRLIRQLRSDFTFNPQLLITKAP